MHSASLENSPRLQRVLNFLRLKGAEGATTREIVVNTSTVAVNSSIAELRECGIGIECLYERTLGNGNRVYRYTLKEKK
jgi:hypothetical protein